MKKIISLLICFLNLLIIAGCSNTESKMFDTLAFPFTEQQKVEKGIVDFSYDFYAENTRAYLKSDNTTEILLYSAPVEESLNVITESNDKYIANGDYFEKKFPKQVSEETPITVGTGNNYINIYFPSEKMSTAEKQTKVLFDVERESVVYADVFGKDMDYICYPTSFGVNTEIVIPKRTKENKYQIKIQLPNLAPDTSSPDYILFKTALEKGQVKSLLYTPLIVDKNGKWSYANSVKLVDKDVENNIYTVEYGVDEEFLNDKNTKYPVTLNQSIHLYKSKQPDTSAYENTGDIASHYLSPYILLGDETLKGEGWTYVRFETLNSLDIDPEKIVSAKYVFHNLFDLRKETKISAYAVKADWCSINTRWFNRPPFDEKPISEVIIKNSGDYKLDITALLVEMMKNKGKENATYSIQNSFMIRSDTADSNVIISSGDNGLFSPVLEIVLSE